MTKTTYLVVLALAFSCLSLGAAEASEDGLDPRSPDVASGERLTVLLDRVQSEQRALSTLEARFVQRKTSTLLLEAAESSGEFSFSAPDSVRWEYLDPEPISLLIVGERMTTWFRDLKQAEQLDVGKHSQQVLKYLGVGSSMASLLKYFDVSMRTPKDPTDFYRLDLEPRYARLGKRLAGVSLWIHPATFLPVRLRYEEADGDVTEYEFYDLKLNAEIPPERFSIDLPEDVELRSVDLAPSIGG